MKLSTFFGVLIAIAAVVAVAALIISKRKIRLTNEDEYDLDEYDVIDDDYDIQDEVNETSDFSAYDASETAKKKIIEPAKQVIEPVVEQVIEKIVTPVKQTITDKFVTPVKEAKDKMFSGNNANEELLDDDDLLNDSELQSIRYSKF